MKADPVLGPIFERYFAVKRNRATLHDRKHGVTSSEERLTTARLAAEAKLIEKMEEDPTYLTTWEATRIASSRRAVAGSYERIRSDPDKRAAYNKRRRDAHYTKNGRSVPEVTESTLEAQLLRIYEEARRAAEKKNREGL